MVESYVVSAKLEVRSNELVEALRRSAAQARALSEQLEKLKGVQTFSRLTDVVTRLNTALGTTAASASRMGEAVAKGSDVAVRGLSSAADQAERLDRALANAERSSRSLASAPVRPAAPTMPTPWRPGPSTTPRPANGNSRPGSLDIPAVPGGAKSYYSVHDSYVAGNTPPPKPPSGAGGSGGGRGGSSGMDEAVAGGISLFTGAAIFKGLNNVATAGGVLGAAQAALKMQMAGDPNSGADFNTAMTTATGLAKKYPMIKLSDAVGMVSDIYSVTGNMDEAASLASTVGGYQAVATSIPGHKADSRALIKAAEASGYSVDPQTHKFSESRIETFVAMATKLLEATHGAVDETALQNFFRQAGPSGRNLTIPAIMQLAPTFTEMGPQKAATAMASAFQEIIGGTMTEKVADALEKIHMINPNQVHKTRTGVRVDPGAVMGSSLFATNPVQWVNTVLVPQLKKEHPTWGPTQTNEELTQIFGRQTVQRLFADLISQSGQYAKDFNQEKQAATAPQALAILNASYAQNVTNFTTALSSLAQVFGSDVVPTLIPGLKALTAGIQDLTGVAVAHPEAAKIIAGAAAAFGGLAVAAGSVLLPLGALRLAIGGLRGPSVAGAAGVAAEEAAGGAGLLRGILPFAGPIGAAIGAGILAYIGMGELDKLLTGSAPPNVGKPRDGYQAPGSPKVQIGDRSAGPAGMSARHDDVGRHVDAQQHAEVLRQLKSIETAVKANDPGGQTITMDGRKVAAVVTRHQVNAARRPTKSSSSHDDSQSPALPSHAVAVR